MALLQMCILKFAEVRLKPESKITVYDFFLEITEASNSGKAHPYWQEEKEVNTAPLKIKKSLIALENNGSILQN